MNFIIGGIYSLTTLSVYQISYIKGIGGSISIDHLTFYYPVEVFFQCISAFISGIIYKEIGLHFTNFIGVSVLSFGYSVMYFSKNLYLDILSMILGGIGTGIILYPSTTNKPSVRRRELFCCKVLRCFIFGFWRLVMTSSVFILFTHSFDNSIIFPLQVCNTTVIPLS